MPFGLYRGIHAPEFEPGLDWVNSRQPLDLHALRGRLVLLEFWTSG